MKVKELLAALEGCDLDSEVVIEYIIEDGRINVVLPVGANSVRPGFFIDLGRSIIISENN